MIRRPVFQESETEDKTIGTKTIAVAGNPNVGKSTLFNHLTNMHQHTGNWPGKTVSLAYGICRTAKRTYQFVDIPGTYSLMAHSAEEEVARNFLCFRQPDAVLIVCDATCLERNLNLVLQILEITGRAMVCVNLLDEAKRKGIRVDLDALAHCLGVPVVGVIARKKGTLNALLSQLDTYAFEEKRPSFSVNYKPEIREAVKPLAEALFKTENLNLPAEWLALRLLEQDVLLEKEIKTQFHMDLLEDPEILKGLKAAQRILEKNQMSTMDLKDGIVSALVTEAETIYQKSVKCTASASKYADLDRKLDHIFTSKWLGYPIMILLLALIFWLTIAGANYPSSLLAAGLFQLEEPLLACLAGIGLPVWFCDLMIGGVYHIVAWVVSIMLPPMAIFFPLFTLLEDSGYLPRVAYNLDRPFQYCHACGKQCLTMCAALGCNAVGVTGCRIIDSPRERLIAILTNNFVPCNGRFPTMIALISVFFVSTTSSFQTSLLSALGLTFLILLGIFMTFVISKLLSLTILKGVPSSFTLELPPYRRPEFGKVILRSILDRTIFVLGRAVCAAAPAGLILWVLLHVQWGEISCLTAFSGWLDPFAKQIGLDGVILMAFLLGIPANEIVLPIVLMTYLCQDNLIAFGELTQLQDILLQNGWTWITAVSMLLFSLMHWPCATTLLTIRKETQSLKWTGLSFLLPTVTGILVCFAFSHIAAIFF